MYPHIRRNLGEFHHRVARRPTGRQRRRGLDEKWMVTPLAEAMAEAMAELGFQEVETYVSRHQKTVVQYIVTRTILDLCLAVER